MITLQRTFGYSAGELPPLLSARLLFRYPVLDVTVVNAATFEALLSTDEVGTYRSWFSLISKTYHVPLMLVSLFSPSPAAAVRSWLRWLYARDGLRPKINDLSITFTVNYEGEEEGSVLLNALWFHSALTDALPVADPQLTVAPTTWLGTDEVVEKGIYALNKDVYIQFVNHLWPALAVERQSILLFVVNLLVDLSGTSPKLTTGKDTEQRAAVLQLLQRAGLPVDDTVYNYVSRNFSKLFDFPLRMPKVKMLSVAGNIHAKKLANGTTPKISFDFYHLSSEYVSIEGRDSETKAPRVSNYVWDSKSVRHDSRIDFSFEEKYARSRISGPVVVRVKGFDGSELYREEFQAMDPALQTLDIAVDGVVPSTITPPTGGQVGQGVKKLRGQVVSLSKSCTLKGVVVVEAKTKTGGPWSVVSTGNSDKDGNFTMPYPYGLYVEARALVSLNTASSTTLRITSEGPNETISSDFIYILLQGTDDGAAKKDDCNCNPTTTAGRLPSQDDLLQSNQFTQDIGGGCINLTVPNRTLREFNYQAIVRHTDPDVANYTLRSTIIPATDVEPFEKTTYYLERNGKVVRNFIDLDNPVQWQDSPDPDADLELYQAVTIATGHILHYKSEFKADGYSLGDLVYSLPLAPGQKKQIVTIDASHSLLGTETQSLTQTEKLANSLINERNIVDQIAGNIGEAAAGSSSASTSGVSAGLGASGSMGAFGASLGVAGGYSNSSSNASQNSSRNLSQFFSERLRQSLQQNAAGYRQQNATVVTAVQEGQKYSATTDVVSNHNHCHSLTMMYFEVLRHFAIFQELVDVEECVFVPLLMTRFTIENVSKWADALAPRLLYLPSNTFMKPGRFHHGPPTHPLVPAFDAAERVRTQWKMVDFPAGRYCDEAMEWVDGQLDIVAAIPRPNTKYDNILSLPVATKIVMTREYDPKQIIKDAALTALTFGLGGGDGKVDVAVVLATRAKIFDGFMRIDENFETVPAAQCIRIASFKAITPVPTPSGTSVNLDPITDFFANEGGELDAWLGYSELLGHGGTVDGLRDMLTKYFQMQLIADWDTIWYRSIAPQIFTKVLGHIECSLSSRFDTTQLSKFSSAGEQVMPVAFNAPSTAIRSSIRSVTLSTSSNAAKKLSASQMVFRVRSIHINYSTAHYHGVLFSGTLNDDIFDEFGANCPTPPTEAEKVSPRLDDKFLTQRLITHLNQNLEYYNKVLWYNLDADRRYLLLDGFKIETFNKYGDHEGFRSLSSVLKNSLIAVAGNSLVLPVAPGYHVSQSLIVAKDAERETLSESLLDHYRPDEPASPYRMSIPTRGVYSEAMMGRCDSCETVKPESAQDWTKFTTEEPTSISPLTALVPIVTAYNPVIKDFAPPMVQIQNTPATPDPAVGLKAVTDLMGKADIFKDITGLDANQRNALQTFLSNQDNVKSMAQMASVSGMVNQAHNTANTAKIMDTINTGHAQGSLTDAQKNQLVNDHAQQMIDGGASKNAENAQKLAAQKPTVTDTVTKAAVEQGRGLAATVTKPDGTVESVNLQGGNKAQAMVLAEVSGLLPPIKQPDDKTCWAAVAAMMVSWQLQTTFEIVDAVRRAGDDYADKFNAHQALNASDGDAFVEGMDMVSEGGASNLYTHYVDLIQKHGPIWVTVDAQTGSQWAPHALLLTKIEGGKGFTDEDTYFTCIDPSKGASIRLNYVEFRKAFEQTLTDADPRASGVGQQIGIQIIYFPGDIQAKVGYNVGFSSFIKDANKPPVHEAMVLRALKDSNFHLPESITRGSDKPTNEFLRGVFWNDDPSGYLFDIKPDQNLSESHGAYWIDDYLDGEGRSQQGRTIPMKNTIGRSHFGDLQFLHTVGKHGGWAEVTATFPRYQIWDSLNCIAPIHTARSLR
ncbi:MAG: hypothetical protein M1840_000789, partial [Geoglossum simile]